MKKMLLVVNPYAGTRKAYKQLADIVSVFNRGEYDVSVYITECAGDAAAVVEQRAQDVDVVTCCGGDGTFNETVTGVLKSGADVPIGYIPAGSTNDFAASLQLPTDLTEAAKRIVDGKPHPYDVGRFADRYFSYVASFGAFTRASYSTPQSVKNALGYTAYLLEGMQELSQIKNVPMMLETENEIVEDKFLFGAVCNSTSLGGFVSLDPRQVDMSDGKFELLLVRAPKDLAEVRDCLHALKHQQYDCGMITFRSTSFVRVWTDPTLPWSLDGEGADGQREIEIENLHHAIRLLK